MNKYQIINSIYNNRQNLYRVLLEYVSIIIPVVLFIVSVFIVNSDKLSLYVLYIAQICEIITTILVGLFYNNSVLNVCSVADIKNVFHATDYELTLIRDRQKLVDSFYGDNIMRIHNVACAAIITAILGKYRVFVVPLILFSISLISIGFYERVKVIVFKRKFNRIHDLLKNNGDIIING